MVPEYSYLQITHNQFIVSYVKSPYFVCYPPSLETSKEQVTGEQNVYVQ
ncbi:hypothetical protein CANDROIZ_390013 [Candidatus Roizmanbacteria bacterium]|nr:hypothetical protein CANDROIZ_390013 [Candidatus Roizmanbacteria bacterium]